MLDYIVDGGWGVYPVLLFGFVTVGMSIAFAVTLRRELLPLLAGFWVTTLLSGCLGSIVGVQATVRFVAARPPFDHAIMASGVREALNVAVVALLFAVLAVLVSSAGGFRVAWRAAERA